MRNATYLLLALGTLGAGCGEVVSGTPGDDDAPEVDGGDVPGPTALTSIAPAEGATGVAITTEISLSFDGDLDPDTIASSVRVFERESQREVPLTELSWDAATRTLTATTARPLWNGWRYRVEVAGLTDVDAVPVAVPTTRFVTRVNAQTGYRIYDDGGRIIGRSDMALTADGFYDRNVSYAIGPDNSFETADDVVTSHTVFDADELGTHGYVVYNAAGPDGAWFTADDVPSQRAVYIQGDSGNQQYVGYSGPGPDGVWMTADDVSTSWLVYGYDAQDRNHEITAYNGVGADGLRFTADDTVQWYARTTFGATSDTYVNVSSAGPDGAWKTADDPAGYTHLTEHDAAGNPSEWRYLDGNGTQTQYMRYEYDPITGMQVRLLRYTGIGADAVWFTADDQLTGYYLTSYQADGVKDRYQALDLGANGTGPDADDRVDSSSAFDQTR